MRLGARSHPSFYPLTFTKSLLIDALRRVLALSKQIGCLGVVADAKDERAVRFYVKYGFVAVETAKWPRRMFMALAILRIAVSR